MIKRYSEILAINLRKKCAIDFTELTNTSTMSVSGMKTEK